jgi:hypothetical protein
MVAWFGVLDISFPRSSLDQIKDVNSTFRLDRKPALSFLQCGGCLPVSFVCFWLEQIRLFYSTAFAHRYNNTGREPFGRGGLSFLRGVCIRCTKIHGWRWEVFLKIASERWKCCFEKKKSIFTTYLDRMVASISLVVYDTFPFFLCSSSNKNLQQFSCRPFLGNKSIE